MMSASNEDPEAPPHIPPAWPNFPFDGLLNKNAPIFHMEYKFLSTDDRIPTAGLFKLSSFKRIATFNFASPESEFPFGTMIIPGAPRLFNEAVQTGALQKDGYFISDVNTYHNPKCPLEPVFRAIDICQGGNFDLHQFDLVTDSYCLMILSYYCHNRLDLDDKPVRFDIQRTGNLVAFTRCEKVPVLKFSNESGPSYGINFKQFVTKKAENEDLTAGGSFQQVFTCSFGSFKLIVNSKVDCAINWQKPTRRTATSNHDVNTIAADFSKLNLKTPAKFDENSELYYYQQGELRNFAVVDLGTRKEGKYIRWDRMWHRAFFTSAKFVKIGRIDMDTGRLFRVEKYTTSFLPPAKERNGDREEGMRQMHFLLRKIMEFVREKDERKRFACIVEKGKPLKIFERNKEDYPKVIPDYYLHRDHQDHAK